MNTVDVDNVRYHTLYDLLPRQRQSIDKDDNPAPCDYDVPKAHEYGKARGVTVVNPPVTTARGKRRNERA